MGITADRTIRMTREERDAFVRWADEFMERALDSGRNC